MSHEASLYTRCAENIALLELLGNIGEPPTPNPHVERPGQSNNRHISLRSERDLVSTLGFLSSIKDDPNNVTAVCIKEEASTLSVLVAANAKGPGKSVYLNDLKMGFDRIFKLLRTSAKSKLPSPIRNPIRLMSCGSSSGGNGEKCF